MRNDVISVIKATPKWKIVSGLLLCALLSWVVVYLLFETIFTLVMNSTTMFGLYEALQDIVGHRKFQQLSNYFYPALYSVCLFSSFALFTFIFYRFEKKKVDKQRFRQIVHEIGHIAEGNFDHRINAVQNDELGHLAKNVNKIVEKLKMSIEEERRAERVKNDLITNVSHDLRTPLTSIMGYLGLIEQDKYKDEVELRHYTQVAFDKALRLHDLINDLFEYTRLQNNDMRLDKVRINIAEMLTQLVVQYRLQLQEAQMVCRENIAAKQLMVLGDSDKLARVFENLLSNAIQYGKAGTFIDVAAFEAKNTVAVEITSYGEPIPSIDLPYIFERFYRVEKSRSKHTGGSGLGLAIAKSIVERHDGSIEASSDTERTIFTVTLAKMDT